MTVFLILVAAVALVALIVYVSNSKSKEEVNRYKEKQSNDSINNNHEWVDLGLPSGTKWAVCNVGANKPEDLGFYFAWGETRTKSVFNKSTYNYLSSSIMLPAKADAATINWGTDWHIPSKNDFEELCHNCIYKWTTKNGVSGGLFIGSNGNSIFLPAAGAKRENCQIGKGDWGYYWMNSLYDNSNKYAKNLYFKSDVCGGGHANLEYGFSVRPVCSKIN